MGKAFLREKDKVILNLIIENYLRAGKPISSGLIAQKSPLHVSPATVRNIMTKLEGHSLLFQPHTSAGRIPTDKGLRFYVSSLLEEALLPDEQINLLTSELSINEHDFNAILNKVTRILAEHSGNLGFVLSPRISRIRFRHVRFVKIAESKAMIILVSSSNFVLKEVFQTNTYFTQIELDKASQYINHNFRGKNLFYVREYLLKELPKYRLRYEDILDKLINLIKAYISKEENESQIFLQGTPKLLEKHDLFDMEKLKSLFENFEEKAKLAKLLSDFISLDRVKVLIGSESNIPDISDCSLVLSHYGYHSQILGSLGIIGPKRIPYKQIIPLVDSMANRLSQTISMDSQEEKWQKNLN